MTTTTVSPAAAAVQSARRCTAAPQDRRILRSKRALRDALIELMEERSFDGFSVNDLCERADLNRGTFYNHFRDKDDLLAQLEAEVMEDLERFQVQMRNLTVHELLGYRARKKPLPLLVGLFDYLREQGDFLHAVLGRCARTSSSPSCTSVTATTPNRSSAITWRSSRPPISASSRAGSRRACGKARRRWRLSP